MHVSLDNIELPVFESDLRRPVAQRLGLKPEDIRHVQLLRRSLDARQHQRIKFICRVAVELPAGFEPPAGVRAEPWEPVATPSLAPVTLRDAAPVVVGTGPAGLFAALALVEAGLPPLVIDRGQPVPQRAADITGFWNEGRLNPESNMYFGEGGAGTFSDGKLTTRSKHPLTVKVLRELVAAGAPEEILYDTRAHLGTDVLARLIPALRQRLEKAGARFEFGRRFHGLRRTAGGTLEVRLSGAWVPARPLVLAIGHSATDSYRLLLENGITAGTKGNAFGFRLEHPADFVTRHYYGANPRVRTVLGNAHYNVSVPLADGAHSAYSFCCCPGGEVVTCSATEGQVSVNGMSFSGRDSAFTNAGLVTNVEAEFCGATAAAALDWREGVEKRCYAMGGGAFAVPAQRAADFVAGRVSTALPPSSSRRPLVPADLATLFPPVIGDRLREGLRLLDRQIPGWLENGLIIGVETTTSAPLRLLRNPQAESASHPGLLPVGEGSGYAGGIVTSALDGYQTVATWLAAAGR